MSSSLNAMSVFAGGGTPKQGDAEQDTGRAVLHYLCASYLGVATEVASVEEAALLGVERFRAGGVAPICFSEFMAGMYAVAKQMCEAIHERTAWLVDLEKQQVHWRQLGFGVYDDYLASIDPLGQVKEMVNLHKNTLRRKRVAESQIQQAWDGAPELGELVTMQDGEDRWRHLASLAKATAGGPDLAKHCLNKTLLSRLREKRPGKVFRKNFTNEDFKRAVKLAEELRVTQWQEDTYTGLGDLDLKLYRGIVMSVNSHPGREDPARIQTVTPSPDTGAQLIIKESESCNQRTGHMPSDAVSLIPGIPLFLSDPE